MIHKNVFKLLLAMLLVATTMGGAFAQEYPSRQIKLICPYAAGGLTDILSRIIAKRLTERLGQSVVVENRVGAGGIIGMESVAKSPADGYTLILVSQGLAAVNTSLYKNLPYNTLKEFEPISLVTNFSMVMLSNPDLPPKSFSEFIAMAKAKPGSLNYGSAGNASTAHLTMELFMDEVGINLVHIPFKGESVAFTEMMGGRLDVMFATLGGAMPFIKSGKLKPLAIGTKTRNQLVPTVPTVSESGVPGFEVMGWYGIMAPAGLPKNVLARLSKEFVQMGQEPEMREMMTARGMEMVGSSPDELGKLIRSETDRWRKVVARANIKPD